MKLILTNWLEIFRLYFAKTKTKRKKSNFQTFCDPWDLRFKFSSQDLGTIQKITSCNYLVCMRQGNYTYPGN